MPKFVPPTKEELIARGVIQTEPEVESTEEKPETPPEESVEPKPEESVEPKPAKKAKAAK